MASDEVPTHREVSPAALGDIEENHEAYRGEGRVAAASAVRGLTRTA